MPFCCITRNISPMAAATTAALSIRITPTSDPHSSYTRQGCLKSSPLRLSRTARTSILKHAISRRNPTACVVRSLSDSNGDGGGGGDYGGGGGGGDDEDSDGEKNKREALMALTAIGRTMESLPADLAAAIKAGRIPKSIVHRFHDLDKSAVFRWLMKFGGFKERLLADDLFLAKVAMECGVGIFTKTAAEYEKRKENFFKELDFVVADVVMAIIADFMLVWLPAPTVSLKAPLAFSAGPVSKFFYNCPENAFQVALTGTSYSFLQRIGAIVRNGGKLLAVGTSASLIGTGVTNGLIKARKMLDKDFKGEAEDVPIISTSVAYGVIWQSQVISGTKF